MTNTMWSSLLLGRGLGLGGLLAVAPYHDHADEGAHDGGTDEEDDDGDADGPDARGEEVLENVVVVNEGLWKEEQKLVSIKSIRLFCL